MRKKNFKKLVCILITVLMLTSLTGCGKSKKGIASDEVITTVEADTTTTATAETTTEDYLSYENPEELQKEIEAEEGYSPMSDEELATFEPDPELYDESEVPVRIYFTNNETIFAPGWMSARAASNMSEEVQTYLDRVGYTDASELKIVKGSEEKTDATFSFQFLMDEHPETVVKVIYYYEMAQFGFEEVKSLKEK